MKKGREISGKSSLFQLRDLIILDDVGFGGTFFRGLPEKLRSSGGRSGIRLRRGKTCGMCMELEGGVKGAES